MNTPFTIQSVSKPLSYGLVLDDLTPDVVHQYVGHEPSGVAFNSIGLNYKGKFMIFIRDWMHAYLRPWDFILCLFTVCVLGL